ncbi:hypothetical protein ACHWQZ_G011751 [Mnemiopsis leidyi]
MKRSAPEYTFLIMGVEFKLAFHIAEHSTVFQAKAYAVEQAAKLLIDGGTKNNTIIINCDSQATIKAVDSTIITLKTTQRAQNELHKLGKDNNVLLRWRPAHKGYLGNEKADELAKKGSGDNEAESVTLPVPRTVWKKTLRQQSHRKMRERWKDMWPHFRMYGYLSKDSSAFVEDPLMIPQLVVPNLKNFKLKAFVSAEISEEETAPPQPIEYLDTITLSTGSFK